jgi:hypothetical protein
MRKHTVPISYYAYGNSEYPEQIKNTFSNTAIRDSASNLLERNYLSVPYSPIPKSNSKFPEYKNYKDVSQRSQERYSYLSPTRDYSIIEKPSMSPNLHNGGPYLLEKKKIYNSQNDNIHLKKISDNLYNEIRDKVI